MYGEFRGFVPRVCSMVFPLVANSGKPRNFSRPKEELYVNYEV